MQFDKSEISIIEIVCVNLYNKFGDLNNGGCGVFARAMNELIGTNIFLYIFEKCSLDEDPPIHVYLKFKRGKFLDASGFSTKKMIYENYGRSSIMLEANADTLNAHYDELGHGLFVLDFKDEYLDIENFIFENYILKNDTTFLIKQ